MGGSPGVKATASEVELFNKPRFRRKDFPKSDISGFSSLFGFNTDFSCVLPMTRYPEPC